MKIIILYFSGTGNTKFIGEKIYESLLAKNYEVAIHSVETFTKEKLDSYDLLIFGYPVYGYAMPPFLKNYLKKLNLPQSKGVITYSTAGYNGGNALRKSAKLLKEIGFIPLLSKEFLMPGNDGLLIKDKNSKKVKEILQTDYNKSSEINNKIEVIVSRVRYLNNNKISKDDIKIPERRFFTLLLDPIMQLSFKLLEGWFGSKYKADENCILCGYCEEICPSDNIVIKNGEVKFDDNCYFCLRCLNQCPVEAIQIGNFTKDKFRYKGPMEDYKPAVIEEKS